MVYPQRHDRLLSHDSQAEDGEAQRWKELIWVSHHRLSSLNDTMSRLLGYHVQQCMNTRHTVTTYPLHMCSSAAILSHTTQHHFRGRKHSAASQADQVDPALSPTPLFSDDEIEKVGLPAMHMKSTLPHALVTLESTCAQFLQEQHRLACMRVPRCDNTNIKG